MPFTLSALLTPETVSCALMNGSRHHFLEEGR